MCHHNFFSSSKIHHPSKTLPSWIRSLWLPARLVDTNRILPYGALFGVQLAQWAEKNSCKTPWLPATAAEKHYAEKHYEEALHL